MATLTTMQVTANGAEIEMPEGATVAALIDHLNLAGRVVVVERNGEPVDRRAVGETVLAPGDRCEIVRAVAGG